MAEKDQRFNIRKETYVSRDLDAKIENAAEQHDMSVSELLREGARRQLQQMGNGE